MTDIFYIYMEPQFFMSNNFEQNMKELQIYCKDAIERRQKGQTIYNYTTKDKKWRFSNNYEPAIFVGETE